MSKLGGEKSRPTGASPSTVTWRNEPGLVCDYTNTCTSFLWRGWDLRYLVRPSSVISVVPQPYVSQRNLRVGKTTCGKEGGQILPNPELCLVCCANCTSSCDAPLKCLEVFVNSQQMLDSMNSCFVPIPSSIIQSLQAFLGWNKKKYVWIVVVVMLSFGSLSSSCVSFDRLKHKLLCFDALQLHVGGADLRPPAGDTSL